APGGARRRGGNRAAGPERRDRMTATFDTLGRITSPQRLRDLSADQLPALGAEIRAFLVDRVCRVGGHLGPNLGVVELTIELHRVFDSPSDRIVFDIG